MLGAAQRYRELTMELLVRRGEAGGTLSQAEEARLASELDRCWQQMTDQEQDDEEKALECVPGAPDELNDKDRPVARGESLLPRQVSGCI